MKVVAVAVSSINGKITNGKNSKVSSWSSREDFKFFNSKISKAKLIVMGSGTYEANRRQIELQRGKLRVVLSKNPKRYSKLMVTNQLEFMNNSPKEIVKKLENKGYEEMLLVGGSKVYSSFLKDKLIDEIFLTIEPLIFGQGKPLFSEDKFDSALKLLSVRKLNSKGTLLLFYEKV